ncbi:hypothetical protein A5663_15875 [Mycobacterium sp. E740]|nr:hypothetical protein A5663_15875 [Mycobacterium sp. E740]
MAHATEPGEGPGGDGGSGGGPPGGSGSVVRDQINTARTTFKTGLGELKSERREAKQAGKDAVNEVKQQIRDYKQEFKSEIRDIKRGP